MRHLMEKSSTMNHQEDFDSPTRRIKTSDYYGQTATGQNTSRDNDLTTLSNFVKDHITSPVHSSNFNVSRHESRYAKGNRNVAQQ